MAAYNHAVIFIIMIKKSKQDKKNTDSHYYYLSRIITNSFLIVIPLTMYFINIRFEMFPQDNFLFFVLQTIIIFLLGSSFAYLITKAFTDNRYMLAKLINIIKQIFKNQPIRKIIDRLKEKRNAGSICHQIIYYLFSPFLFFIGITGRIILNFLFFLIMCILIIYAFFFIGILYISIIIIFKSFYVVTFISLFTGAFTGLSAGLANRSLEKNIFETKAFGRKETLGCVRSLINVMPVIGFLNLIIIVPIEFFIISRKSNTLIIPAMAVITFIFLIVFFLYIRSPYPKKLKKIFFPKKEDIHNLDNPKLSIIGRISLAVIPVLSILFFEMWQKMFIPLSGESLLTDPFFYMVASGMIPIQIMYLIGSFKNSKIFLATLASLCFYIFIQVFFFLNL